MAKSDEQNRDGLVLLEEQPGTQAREPQEGWKVLIVDDEEEIHALTRIVLSDFSFRGRRLVFLHAYSAKEARALIREHRDTSLILLDVVMERYDAGLQFVRYVRETLRDSSVQIIIRTGQPGVAPERHVVEFYEISDYKEKTELTAEKLYSAVMSALRAYILTRSLEDAVTQLRNELEERRRIESERELLAKVVEQVGSAVVIADAHGVVQHVNHAFETLTGYAAAEVVGSEARVLEDPESDPSDYEKRLASLAQESFWQGRLKKRKKDGTTFFAEVTLSALRDKAGKVTHIVSISRDITSEMQLEARLRHAQKMEALGTLAGGMAHDFNNALTGILGHIDLAMRRMASEGRARESLLLAASAGKRAAGIIRRILSFSRQTEERRRIISLNDVIQEVLELLRGTLPPNIDIHHRVDGTCGCVLADPGQIQQVLLNLCTNAYHAMSGAGGRLEINLQEVVVGPGSGRQHSGLRPGRYAELSVTDTGRGIDPAILERIFEPYFTTKEPGVGTGLGLAMVHGIVQNHNGDVTVESRVGVGSTFRVLLPICDDDAQATAGSGEERGDVRGHERVLFVDDEEIIVQLVKEGMENLGYSVEAFTRSAKALDAFRAAPDRFDVVITDLVMPQFNGLELGAKLLDIRPDVPVILCTGTTGVSTLEQSRHVAFRDVVPKPFVSEDLARSVRKIMGPQPPPA